MRRLGIIATSTLLLSSNMVFAGVLTDADIKPLADTVAKTYAADVCKNDIPDASKETCECLGKGIATHLQDKDSVEKLKACGTDGYDNCISAQVTAAKSALTEQEINACKALTTATTTTTTTTTPDATTQTTTTTGKTDTKSTSTTETKSDASSSDTSNDD